MIDRKPLDASLAASGFKPTPVQVQNDPPQVVVSYRPAILVPVNREKLQIPDDPGHGFHVIPAGDSI